MVDWLVQSVMDHPLLAEGIAPPSLLTVGECRQLASFRVQKLRRDWLLGRWTAKHLLASVLARDEGVAVPLQSIGIGNDPGGAPFAGLEGGQPSASGADARLPYVLTISHSSDHACCAVHAAVDGEVLLGVDLERVEARAPAFADTFFTPAEVAAVRAASVSECDLLTTLIWSAKESALKALRQGLRVDTRSLSCQVRFDIVDRHGWHPLAVELWPGLAASAPRIWSGRWRQLPSRPDLVLTMVWALGERGPSARSVQEPVAAAAADSMLRLVGR